MVKTILPAIAILFFSSCNHTAPPKPDADRVIKDTLAQLIMQPFNQAPKSENIYVKVEPRQEKFLCPRNSAIILAMNGLKYDTQKFVIDNTQPAEITGAQGTKLIFKPNCFVGANGSEINSPVTVELKECYTLDAMLKENLVTAMACNFSAGKAMVYVNAFANGQNLQLKTGETINAQFPFEINGRNGYSFYHGIENTDGIIAWNTTAEANTTKPKVFTTGAFLKPSFSNQGQGLKEYLLQNLNYPDEAKRNELSAKVEVSFVVDAAGNVRDVITAESYKIFRQAIEQSLKNMPAWSAAVYNGKTIASMVHVNIDFNIRRAQQVQVDFNEDEASLISAGNKMYVLYGADLKGEVARNLSAQVFDQMGWFNYCKPITGHNHTAELIVSVNEKTEVKLLMKKTRTLIGAEHCLGYADFKNLPTGEQAYIIAVKYDNGNMLYAIEPVTLNKQTIITPQWKKGNNTDITNAYRKLSKELS